MAKCINNGQLNFVDCFTQLLPGSGCNLKSTMDTNTSLNSYSLDLRSVQLNGGLYIMNSFDRNMSLKLLYLKLKAEVDKEMSRGNSCCVIIDDYSLLLSLGVDLSHLIDFIHYLRVMLCSSNVRILIMMMSQ